MIGPVAGFTLMNQDGQVTTLANLSNHVWVADIIFTRCAGSCPIMSKQMKSLQDALPPASQAKLVTLTTDPDFDTPPVLKKYGERFGADSNRWMFLTGTKLEIGRLAANSLKLSAVPVKPEDQQNPADLFIHSTIFVIVDKHARLRGTFETEGDGGELDQRPAAHHRHRGPTRTRDDDHSRPARRQCLAQRPERGFPDRRLYFHPAKKPDGAPQLHDRGVRHLDCFFDLLPDLSHLARRGIASRADAVLEPQWFRPIYLVILLTHTVLAVVIVPMILVTLNRARRQNFEAAQKNRPLDVAVVDVCFRDRRGGLSAALPDFPANRTRRRSNVSMNPNPHLPNVRIHASQFPEEVRRDLLDSLRTRRVNHKFHYDSVKQTQKWLALHQAYSPTRNDADCRAVYEQGFKAAAAQIKSKAVHVIGLGCGGGQKDTRLLKLLKSRGREIFYTPCDVSTAMVLVARQTALAVVPEKNCFPFVCDLATADDLSG